MCCGGGGLPECLLNNCCTSAKSPEKRDRAKEGLLGYLRYSLCASPRALTNAIERICSKGYGEEAGGDAERPCGLGKPVCIHSIRAEEAVYHSRELSASLPSRSRYKAINCSSRLPGSALMLVSTQNCQHISASDTRPSRQTQRQMRIEPHIHSE